MGVKNTFMFNFVRHTQLHGLQLLMEDNLLIAQNENVFLKLIFFENTSGDKDRQMSELLFVVGDAEQAFRDSFFYCDSNTTSDDSYIPYIIYTDESLSDVKHKILLEWQSLETKIRIHKAYTLISQKGTLEYFMPNPQFILFLAGRLSYDKVLNKVENIDLPKGLYIQEENKVVKTNSEYWK